MKQYGLLFVICLLSLAACNKDRDRTESPPPPTGNILFKTELNNAEYSDLELTIVDENQKERKQALTDFKLEQGVHNIRIDAQQGLKCELDVQPDPGLASTQILKVNCQDAPLTSQYAYLNLGSKDTDVSLAGVEVKLEGIVSNDTITMETDEVTVTITQTSTSSGKKTFPQESKLSQLKVSTQATEFKVVNIETQLGSEDGSEFLTDESGRLTLRYDSRLFSGDNLEHLPLLIATFQCSQDLTASDCQLRHPVRVALTADQFLSEQWSAHPLTEAVYQTLRYYLLAGYGIDQIMEYMNGLSDYLLVSENGGHYESLLNWNPEEENKIYQAEKVRGLGDLLLSKEISEEEISSDIEQKIQEIISLEYIISSSEGSINLNPIKPNGNLFFVSPYALDYKHKMRVADGYAYVPGEKNGFIRINIADPKNLEKQLIPMSEYGTVKAIAIKDQYAFVTAGPYKEHEKEYEVGLHSINLKTLKISSSFPLEGEARSISIYDDSAFVAAGAAGIYEIDISNPDHLNKIDQYKRENVTKNIPGVSSKIIDVIAHNGYIFAVTNTSWITYIDLNQLHQEDEQQEIFFSPIKGLKFEIMNVWNLVQLFVGQNTTLTVGMDFKFHGDWLYIAYLEISLDAKVFNHYAKSYISSCFEGDCHLDLEPVRDLPEIFEYFSYKLVKFNISNPGKAEMIGKPVKIDGRPTSIDVDGEIVIVSTANPFQGSVLSEDPMYAFFDIYEYNSGIKVFDFSNPEDPEEKKFIKTAQPIYSIVFDQDLFYARSDNSIEIISENKTVIDSKVVEPVKDKACNLQHKVLDLKIKNNLAYLAAGQQGLKVLELDDHCGEETVIGNGFTKNLVIEDNTAYLVNTWDGVELVDISKQSQISPLDSLEMEFEDIPKEDVNLNGVSVKIRPYSTAVAIWPPYTYAAFSRLDYSSKKDDSMWKKSTLVIAPIQNSRDVTGKEDFPGPVESLAIHGDYVYVAQGDEGLNAIKIKDPNQPKFFSLNLSLKVAMNLVIKDQYAYVAAGSDGLVILDLSDPENLTIKSETKVTGRVSGILIDGPYAYVSDDRAGFSVLDIQDVSKPVLLGRYQGSSQIKSMQIAGGTLHVSHGDQYMQLRALPHSKH